MEYYPDTRQGYQQICCQMARAISRGVELLDQSRCREARDLLARTREEVDQVTAWLTGYTAEDIARLEQSDTSYGDFFRNAPAMNPNRTRITGKVCGVRVEEIEDPLMREIRYLDKLVDELAKGKAMAQILRT